MVLMSLLVIAGGLAVLALLAIAHSRNRVASRSTTALTQPMSLLHVIESDEELRAALIRAARNERAIAEVALARAGRYEEMMPPAPVAELRRAPTTDAEDAHESVSAA